MRAAWIALRSGSLDAVRGSEARSLAVLLIGAVVVAAGILWALPVVGGVLVVLLIAVATWPRRATALPKLFLTALGVALLGYATLHRGFAHLGVQPVYIGEVVLGLGLLAALLGGGIRPAFRSPISWLLLAFIFWGAVRTVPYLDEYGLNAVRDGATWGYAIFGLLVAGLLLRTGWFTRVLTAYARVVPVILLSIPIITLLGFAGVSVSTPDGINLIQFRGGPMAVQLAGCGAFLALGLHAHARQRGSLPLGLREWFMWTLWFIGCIITASQNRGGMLAILGAAFVVIVLRPFSRWGKLAFIAVFLVGGFFLADPTSIVKTGKGRALSPDQVLTNLLSVFQEESKGSLDATREWRLEWWDKILDYTVFGRYFWTGKGYGINLAVSDGINPNMPGERHPLRSPHNSHFTILARGGVPGLFLWILLHAAFAIGLLRAYRRARAAGHEGWACIDIWILAYWTAININTAFDVYLEGPHGGIWLWSVFGFGIAALELQRPLRIEPMHGLRRTSTQSQPPSRPAFRGGSESPWRDGQRQPI